MPFLLGLLLGGFIDHFVPKEYIVKLLSGPRKRVIARSTILGFLASSCSHGCLALTIELYRKGASVPAVVSFLLASPWASMSLTFILLSLFGLKGVVIVLGALAIAFLSAARAARAHRVEPRDAAD
ncbi:MAG: permease [Candidatus Omnitrophica bacterium]|nr:permease [Candidatus Omnitrophota bacterium]